MINQTEHRTGKITRYLTELIESGELQQGDRLPAERRLAEQFATSNSPVRQAIDVLERKGLVQRKRGSGVYIRNSIPVKAGKIALLYIPTQDTTTFNPNHVDLLNGIETALASSGRKLLMQALHDDGNGSIKKTVTSLMPDVDGFIVVGGHRRMYEKIYEIKQHSRKPFTFVFYSGHHRDVDYIVSDNYSGAYEMTRFLLEQGHTRIACIANKGNHRERHLRITIQDRIRGYRHALEEAGIEVRDEYCVALENRRDANTFKTLMALDNAPTAVFCTGDFSALALYRFAYDMQLRIPDDITITGYSNMHESTYAVPALTTYSIPGFEAGQAAVQKLQARLQSEQDNYRGTTTVIPGEIIKRESHGSIT